MDMTFLVAVEGSGRGIEQVLRVLANAQDKGVVEAKWIPHNPRQRDPGSHQEKIIKGTLALIASMPPF